MTAPDKPEGLIAGGEQVRAKASHNPTPEGQGGGAYPPDVRQIAEAIAGRPDLFPENHATMRMARAIVSSPRVEEVRREALEEAADNLDDYALSIRDAARDTRNSTKYMDEQDRVADIVDSCVERLRALSLQVG